MQKLPFIPDGTSPLPEDMVDVRTDEEIACTLREHTPPTDSDKNVWAYWRSGFDSMPAWTQRNVINWVRLLRYSLTSDEPWTVRVLDSVPGSPNNVSNFIESRLLPKSFHEDSMTGLYTGAHSADLVRLPLLHRHGGVWIDAGTLLIRHLDDIWSIITDPANPFELVGTTLPLRPDDEEHILVNPLLATRRGNEFVRRWHQIYLALWAGGARDAAGFHAHPLLRHLPLFHPPSASGAPDIRGSPEAYTDYLAHALCAVRLRDLIDPGSGADEAGSFDGRRYYETRICLLPALRELYRFPLRNAWDGRREFAVLATPAAPSSSRPDDPNPDPIPSPSTSSSSSSSSSSPSPPLTSSSTSPLTSPSTSPSTEGTDGTDVDADAARALVADTLANSTAVKLSHGSHGSPVPWLAQLWSDPAHAGADDASSSLAEYLRRAPLRVRQTRALVPSPVVVGGKVWRAGLLEPCE